ncbi:ATP dependent DNA ligase [Coprinellus micaceus]|uniref:ATP dependent DNA ligase n=1 Tax=Coprinellus micaceus TaxID=71717 RepID=A0A4Y7TWJ7_COPMI|nr:ATP dependent DNA ligase [Coprinellus micaceus]
MADTTLSKFRGAVALAGDSIHILVRDILKRALPDSSIPPYDPSFGYHVTLLSKTEARLVGEDKVSQLLQPGKADTRHLHCVGLGGNKPAGVLYLAIIWAAGQQLRKQLGLPPKHFHITLTLKDDHDMDKSVRSLFPGQFLETPSFDLLDHLAFTLQCFGDHTEAQTYSVNMVALAPENPKGFLRLADAALASNTFKLAMLSYACAYDRAEDPKLRAYCLKKLIACSAHTEWGAVFQEEEISQIPTAIGHLLVAPWSPALRQALAEEAPTPSLILEPRDSLFIPRSVVSSARFDKDTLYKLPRFFRWLIPFRFAIMSTPRHEDDIHALASPALGIRRVLTLTEETPLRESWFNDKPICNTFLPIPNFHPPSIEQMDLVMRLFLEDENLPLLVHCGGGKGRAGTVAACYMSACGFKCPTYAQAQPEIPASDAISVLRSLRPGSIETSQQEAFVHKWCSTLWKRQSLFPELPSEPLPCPMVTEGKLDKDSDFFMLVGLPGSGKSWMSMSLLARDPSRWVHISQDESGSRSLCESAIGRVAKGKRVLFDRCNVSASDRKLWLDLASTWSTSAACVWFDYDRELCESRAQLRAGHPTLPPGGRVRNAINQMSNTFDRPSLGEGFKAIVTIRSFQAAQEFVAWLSPPVTISKFPRTPHLLDLGAATDDDVRADASALAAIQGHVVITEKIDGANMGLSLSNDRLQIVVQNRSHYVNSSTHEQFKKLGLWVERHKEELIKLLDRDPYFPERYILYGEWMYATHSIPYTHLPDYFIAYDFYDRSAGSWLGTKALKSMLSQTSISSVPVMQEGDVVPSEAELKAMVQRQSSFYEGRVEGVYVKIERGGNVVYRAKVVRSDFIAGNEHWTRGGIRPNSLIVESGSS